MNLADQLKTLSHHAYALIGGEDVQTELISILETQHSVRVHGNQDLYTRIFTNMTIDDAREVKAAHIMRPVSQNGRKIFILQMNSITVEAQNALLKLLEEPAGYAIFFIIIPSSHLLIPTVKSRMELIMSDDRASVGKITGEDIEIAAEAEKFVRTSTTKRLEIVKSLTDMITKEKKTKRDAIDLLNAMQASIYREKGVKIGHSSLASIEIARKYMDDRSASMKMLLEYIALSI